MPDSDADFLTSPQLTAAGFRHAFFTRRGGASSGEYGSLNFSFAVGDRPEQVSQNFLRGARALELGPDRLYFLSQVHGCGVLELNGREDHAAVLRTEGDALVSGEPTLACCVRSADCVPILVADRATGRAAAIHAGWRGLVAGVIPRALQRLGGEGGNWLAAIGPHIGLDSFEVADEVAQELAAASTATAAVRLGALKPHVDLEQIARAQLQAAGIQPASVDRVGGCTFVDADEYFSYRRQGRQSGRHLSGIRPLTAR